MLKAHSADLMDEFLGKVKRVEMIKESPDHWLSGVHFQVAQYKAEINSMMQDFSFIINEDIEYRTMLELSIQRAEDELEIVKQKMVEMLNHEEERKSQLSCIRSLYHPDNPYNPSRPN